MRKTLSLFLALVMCLSLAACGGGPEPAPTEPNIAGTYKTADLFDTTYVFNKNTTYDIVSESRPIDEGKGTYNVDTNGGLLLNDVDGGTHNFQIRDGYIYRTDALSYFDKDEDYGLGLSLDSNGMTNQTFQSGLIYLNGDRHIFVLMLKDDGTCVVKYHVLADKGWGERLVEKSYDGTYSVENDIMTVNYNGTEHTMLIEDGILYFYILEKVS